MIMKKTIAVIFAVFMMLIIPMIPNVKSDNTDGWFRATDNAAWPARQAHKALVFDGKMWIMGGDAPGYVNDVWYSTDGVNWTMAVEHANWSARDMFSAFVYDGKMWVVGGINGGMGTDIFKDCWNSNDGINWNLVTADTGMNGKAFAGCVVYDNKMWIVGGDDYNYAPSNDNDVWYSTDGVNWAMATLHANWDGRCCPEMLVYDNKMWVIGGEVNPNNGYNDVWWTTDGISWTQATASAGWSKRYSHTVAVWNDRMWVMGGCDGSISTVFSDVWCSIDGSNWIKKATSTGWGLRFMHQSVVYNNYVWLLGGNDDGNLRNDTWYMAFILPTVTTNTTTNVSFSTVTLNGYLVDDGNQTCNVKFEYGFTTNYGNSTNNQTKVKGESFSANIANLIDGTLYHFRAVANNSGGLCNSSDSTFNTLSHNPPPPPGLLTNWSYVRRLMINHSMIDESLSSFPLLVNLTFLNTSHVQVDGDDIIFISDGNFTIYPHEIELYNATTGELLAWVNIPYISSTSDTVFYMYYGNSNCSNQQDVTGTWNSGYTAVYHFNGADYQHTLDSTVNHLDSVGTASTPVFNDTGFVDGAVSYDGSNDATLFPLSTKFSSDLTAMTIESWAKNTDSGFYDSGICGKLSSSLDNSVFRFSSWSSDARLVFQLYGLSSGGNIYITRKDTDDTFYINTNWHYYVGTWDGTYSNTGLKLFVDSVGVDDAGSDTGSFTGVNTGNSPFSVGDEMYTGGYTTWQGMIDEFRLSNVERNTSWINATYDSIFETSDFIILGDETLVNHPPDKPTCVSPYDTETDVTLTTTLKGHVFDIDNDLMTVSFYWGNGTLIQQFTGVQSDSDVETDALSLSYNTEYSWYIICNDSLLINTSDVFTFTTISTPNHAPNQPILISPINYVDNISINTKLKCHVIDMNNDNMTVTFYWFNNATPIETIYNVANDTDVESSALNLEYNTSYAWNVIANDSILENLSNTEGFTTESQPIIPPTNNAPDKPTAVYPVNDSSDVPLSIRLEVHAVDMDNDSMVVSFYWINDSFIGNVNGVVNNSYVLSPLLDLNYDTQYSWYAESYDGTNVTRSDNFTFGTLHLNHAPDKPTLISPDNDSTNISIITTLKVSINDTDNDSMTLIFYWANNTMIQNFLYSPSGSIIESSPLSLEYNTTYTWYAVASDGFLEGRSDNFTFTTESLPTYPPWDINQDGIVNYLDVSALVSHYGQSGAPGWIPEDINSDGFVNYLDVSSLVSHYGESY